jgi:hypothetical protein
MMITKLLKYSGYTAIIAALLGAVSDVLLLYSPDGGFFNPDFQFLNDISFPRLLAGVFLGVFCIPFEILGSWQIYSVTKQNNPQLALITFMFAIYFACIGISVHVLYGVTGVGIHLHSHLPTDYAILVEAHFKQMMSFMQPLATVVLLLHILNTILFVILLRKTNAVFPSWLSYVNPVSIYILLASSYVWWPALGNILAPAAFNLSYGIFFIITNHFILKSLIIARPHIIF